MDSNEVYTYIEDPTPPKEVTYLPLTLGLLVLLNIVSMGLYSFYWFYCNWRDLDVWDEGHRPWLKTLGLLVPILNLFIMYRFFKQIAEYVDDKVARLVSPLLLTFLFQSSLAIRYNADKWKLGDILGTLLSVGVMTLVLFLFQMVIVAYWREREEETRTRLLLGEKILCAVGILLWIVMFLPE